jgi:hypothetical protein
MVGPPAGHFVRLAVFLHTMHRLARSWLCFSINAYGHRGGLKMSIEMIIAVSVMAVIFIVISMAMQKSKSKKS